MALTPDADQFSQFLRLAFLRSPNYAAGVSGWTINQDGSVEFNNGTFRGSIVGGALFIYSGVPGLGNPPQLAIVPGTTTQDPYGNAVTSSKILMQNNVITMSGGIFRTAAAAPLIQLDGNHNAVLIYDSGGHLRETMAPAATTDGLGNTVYAGIVDYSTAVNAIAQLLNGFLNVGTPGQIAGTGGAAPGQVGLASAGNPGVVRVDSGLTATGDTHAFVDVRSTNAQSSISGVAQRNIQLAGPLALSSEGSAPAQLAVAQLWTDGSGFANAKAASGSGDTVVYQVGQATFRNTADQTGISGQVTITGLSAALGTGLYEIRGIITANNTSAGNDTFTVGVSGSGGLVVANMRVNVEWFSITANTFKGAGQMTALGTRVGITSAAASGESCYAKVSGILNISTAGIFNLTAGLSAGLSMAVNAYSHATYTPAN